MGHNHDVVEVTLSPDVVPGIDDGMPEGCQRDVVWSSALTQPAVSAIKGEGYQRSQPSTGQTQVLRVVAEGRCSEVRVLC